MLQHYRFSIVFTLVCLALALWYGLESTGTGTARQLWIIVVLSVLEVSGLGYARVVHRRVFPGRCRRGGVRLSRIALPPFL